MMDRESKIQELCRQILNIQPERSEQAWWYDPHYAYTCQFCKAVKHRQGSMEVITHEKSCAYLMAKDLTTN